MRTVLLIAFITFLGFASKAQTSGTATLNIVLSDVQSVKIIKNELPVQTKGSGIISSQPDLTILNTIDYEVRKVDVKADPLAKKLSPEAMIAQAAVAKPDLINSRSTIVKPEVPHHIYQINPR